MTDSSPPRLRFVAESGLANRLAAAIAGPIIVGSGRIVAAAATTKSPRLVHALERRFGRLAERLTRIHIDIDGLDRIDRTRRYVVVALHEGLADALALLRLPLGLRFLARDELFDWPGLGPYLHATGHPLVETSPRPGSARRLYRQIESVFEHDDNLVVFAQGSILGLEIAFQPGALHIARRFEHPILPVVLTGSHRVWEHPYSPTLRLGERISMRILPPIPPDRLDPATFRDMERSMKRVALGVDVALPRHFIPERDGWWDGYRFEIDPDFPELRRALATHRSEMGTP
ncbi:MAG: lysophospholipid acyltransferase family protein [Acidimicrobiia bacterium]